MTSWLVFCLAVLTSGVGSQQHSPLKRSVSLTPPMSGPSNQPLGHVWLSQEDLRSARGPAPDHAPLSPQSSIASSGSGGSEHLEEAGLGGGLSLHRSSFHEEGSGMRGEKDIWQYTVWLPDSKGDAAYWKLGTWLNAKFSSVWLFCSSLACDVMKGTVDSHRNATLLWSSTCVSRAPLALVFKR